MSRIAVLSAIGLAGVASLAFAQPASPPAAATPTPAAKPARKPCFFLPHLRGTRADGPNHLYARVNTKDIYRFDFRYPCNALPMSTNGVVLKTAGGSALICSAIDVDISVRDHGVSERCMVDSMTKLTPDEIAKLSPKQLPSG